MERGRPNLFCGPLYILANLDSFVKWIRERIRFECIIKGIIFVKYNFSCIIFLLQCSQSRCPFLSCKNVNVGIFCAKKSWWFRVGIVRAKTLSCINSLDVWKANIKSFNFLICKSLSYVNMFTFDVNGIKMFRMLV